jgi:nitroreductase
MAMAPAGLTALLHRYSLGGKDLADPGPSPEECQLIAAAALRAPDHGELSPFRLLVVRGDARAKLADLFEAYARREGKSEESCAIERSRATLVPVTIAVVARIDLSHPVVPAHEQWACVGGAIANVLNALHLLGYAGKMLSGGKVRDQQIVNAFCRPGETLVGWIVAGTPVRPLRVKSEKSVDAVLGVWEGI